MLEPFEVAEILDDLYERDFDGKVRGKYKISKDLFKKLCGRNYIGTTYINQVIEEAYELGLVVIPLEEFIVVVSEDILLNCRNVDEKVIFEYDDIYDDEDDFFEEENGNGNGE